MNMRLTARSFDGLSDQVGVTLKFSDAMIQEWAISLDIVRLARFIVSGCIGRREEAERVRQWIRETIEYRHDPAGHEMLQDPMVTLSERAGDCDDMTVLAGALLAAIGHECYAVGVRWVGEDDPSHEVLFDETAGCVVDAVSPLSIDNWPPESFRVAEFVRS